MSELASEPRLDDRISNLPAVGPSYEPRRVRKHREERQQISADRKRAAIEKKPEANDT